MRKARTYTADRSIPAMTAGPITEDYIPVLLWVHTGTAIVEAAGDVHRLAAGEAIWIPPGVTHRTRTSVGAVVLPIFPRMPKRLGALAEVRVVPIPNGWEDWLLFQFDWNGYHSLEALAGANALLSLVVDGASRDDAADAGGRASPVPMPSSREASAVAQAVLRSPGSPRGLSHFAERENVSVRTVQRQFRTETGMSFSEWRTRVRVTVAASHLTDGRDIGSTGRHVGYTTPAGFTRAFGRHFGVGPREYARRAHASPRRSANPLVEATTQLAALVADKPQQSPHIPPRQVWNWVFDWHVLWWACRGQATLRIGTREFSMHRGQAMWLPAGFLASVTLAEGSILLPLGNRHGGIPIGVDELNTYSLSGEAEAFLLHTVVAEYTFFHSDIDRVLLADDLFRDQFVAGTDSGTSNGPTGAVAEIAWALRRDPADSRSLAEWASHLHISRKAIGEEFLAQTGGSFPHWRAQLRMSLARELLMFGDPVHEVSRTLGYATPATFSKVFTTAHGISPRRYRHQASRKPA